MKCDSTRDAECLLMDIESDSELVELAQLVGIDQFKVVLSILGGPMGMQIYIPTYESFIASIRRSVRDQNIHSTYDGTPDSIKALAVQYGISKSRVRQILANKRAR